MDYLSKTTVLATWEKKYFSFLGALEDLGFFMAPVAVDHMKK